MPFFPDNIAASHSCSSFTPHDLLKTLFQPQSKPLVYSHNSAETVSSCLCEIQLLFSIPCFQMCFPHPSATHCNWHQSVRSDGTHGKPEPQHICQWLLLLLAVQFLVHIQLQGQVSSALHPSSLSSLPAFTLPGVLCCLCFTNTTCLVLWAPSAAPSTWRLVTEATSMPLSGVTWTFHLPASGTVPSAAKLAQLHWLQQLSASVVTQPRTSPRSLITHLLINASCDHWSDPQLG